MDYRIKEVIKRMTELEQYVSKTALPKLDQEAIANGLNLSKRTCAQVETVFATPWMKNLLVIFGDVKQTKDPKTHEWKTEKLKTGTDAKAVRWMNDVVNACLLKYNGKPRDTYDKSRSPLDPDHYNVDCWLGWKKEIWDIQPGQAKQREETFKEYGNIETAISVKRVLELLKRDTSLQQSVCLFLNDWPQSKASREVTNVSDPFMNKRTGVSYPYYRNDSTRVSGGQITYGRLCVENVRKAFEEHGVDGLYALALSRLVYTGYPRNQRGKGRALEAMSREFNIIVNMVNSSEMDGLKEKNFGTGLKSEEGIKKDLIQVAEFVETLGSEYTVENWDYSSYDKTVGSGLVNLGNAVRSMKTNGQLGQDLIRIRHLGASKAWFVNGPLHRVYPIYGRTMSGYDDTTLQNTSINRIVSTAAAMSVDPDYTKKVYYPSKGLCVITLGDDLLIIFKKDKEKEIRQYIESLGFKLHTDNKDAHGVMFIQYRLIREDGEYKMAYNWPRVLRSMLSKEDQKQLGKCGWVLGAYQQLGKLLEMPKFLAIPLNIIAALDFDHLMLDTPVSQIIRGAVQEDKERLQQAKDNYHKSRIATTAERLAGNPNTKDRFVNDNGELNENAFDKIQQALKKVYDPHFLEKLGFKAPDLSKVH